MLDAIASLVGIMMQARAQQDANKIQWANLFETKNQNRKQNKFAKDASDKSYRLSTSSQADALGNLIYFDEATNSWKIDTTEMTDAILSAEQREQLATLTEDAPRNRAAAERKDRRSKVAEEDLEREMNEYRYRHKPSEGEYIGDAQQEALLSRRQGLDEAGALLARQMLRTGGDIREVFNEADNIYADSLEETMLRGKQVGRERYMQDTAFGDTQAQQAITFLQGIADDTTSMAPMFGDENQRLAAGAEGALAQLLATVGSNAQRQLATGDAAAARSQSAHNSLADSLRHSPDFSSLASSLGRLTSSMTGGKQGRTIGDTSGDDPMGRHKMIHDAFSRIRGVNGF